MQLIKQDNKYILRCNYEQRNIPKEAGFRWDGQYKVWWTDDINKALSFKNFATDDNVRKEIESAVDNVAIAVDASRADDAEIDIPKPDGLEYLGYQKAGIKYALIKFGLLKG